jgi:hypothetical protein
MIFRSDKYLHEQFVCAKLDQRVLLDVGGRQHARTEEVLEFIVLRGKSDGCTEGL